MQAPMQAPIQAPIQGQALQDSRIVQQFSGATNNVTMNLAFFPFRTRDGSPAKPGSPYMSGSIQFTIEQIEQLRNWAMTQQPDAYGKIRIGASLWQDTAQTTGQAYLKGNAKIPLPSPAGPMVQAMPSQVQAAQNHVQNQVWPQTPQTPGPIPMGRHGQTSLTGNPLPAWNNQEAYQQQNGLPVSTPMPTPLVQQPTLSQPQASLPLQPQSGQAYSVSGTPPMQPMTSPQGQPVGNQTEEIPF